jgi:hypothetical protein
MRWCAIVSSYQVTSSKSWKPLEGQHLGKHMHVQILNSTNEKFNARVQYLIREIAHAFINELVWTPCLMHRYVCIWRYILQNYNYKLHFQNLSIYHIPHISMGTLAAENLDVCTACDLWDSKIQLTMGKDRGRQIYVEFVADIDIKILGMLPPGTGHAFPRQWHMCRKGVLFICARVFFPVWCHPWMDDGTDGWKKFQDVLYYM